MSLETDPNYDEIDEGNSQDKISLIYQNLFRLLYTKFNIKIEVYKLIDFADKNDKEKSGFVLAMHAVYLMLHSFFESMHQKDSLSEDDIKLIMGIKESIIDESFWNFTPDERYLNLARNFLKSIHE